MASRLGVRGPVKRLIRAGLGRTHVRTVSSAAEANKKLEVVSGFCDTGTRTLPHRCITVCCSTRSPLQSRARIFSLAFNAAPSYSHAKELSLFFIICENRHCTRCTCM